MQSRLDDLRRIQANDVINYNKDIELGNVDNVDNSLDEFYNDREKIGELIKNLENNINLIEEKCTESLATFMPDLSNRLMSELDTLIKNTNQLSKDINTSLKNMLITHNHKSDASMRIIKTTHMTFSKKFYDLMIKYQNLKTNNTKKYRDKVKYQVEIAIGEVPSDDMIDNIIESGNTNQIFANKILSEKKNQDAQNALIFVKDQHKDILKLEKSIEQINQLFIDVGLLIESQGEMLDLIEHNVIKSAEHVENAGQQIHVTNELAKRSRKKLFIIIALIGCICCAIIITLIVVFLAFCFGSSYCKFKH